MSGSRLGRGRGGRLAVYGGCGVVVILLVLLYRAATSEMARLRDLHVQCAHQEEALAAQLQVIFEYKMRLEKSLAEEKSSNAAVKQELQQRASRERSLRDKDSIEAMQRFNSLQQTYKLLQTEHQDLQDECKKREKQALEDTNRLESTLHDLRSRIKVSREEKDKSLEHLKTRNLELDTEKTKLEEKYNEILRSSGNNNSTIEHLRKEVFQLRRELEEAKKFNKLSSPGPSLVSPQSSQQMEEQAAVKSAGGQTPIEQPLRVPEQQNQQVSRPNNDDELTQPLRGPPNHHAIGDALSENKPDEGGLPNGVPSDVGFAEKGGIIVPVGPNDVKERPEQTAPLPMPYDYFRKQGMRFRGDEAPRHGSKETKKRLGDDGAKKDDGEEKENDIEDEKEEENIDEERKAIGDEEGREEESGNEKGEKRVEGKERENNDDYEKKGEEREEEEQKFVIPAPNRANARAEKARQEVDELQNIQEQSTSSSSSVKVTPTRSSSGNAASTTFDKILPPGNPVSKIKLPLGVVPVPLLMEKRQEDAVKKEDSVQNPLAKNPAQIKDHEEAIDADNLDGPFLGLQPAHHVPNQILDRRPNGGWYRVAPGVQEIGDEPNPARLLGADDPADRQAELGEDQYDADYEKDLPQKNNDLHLIGEEDEGEDEDDQPEFSHNSKQGKRE